MTTPFSSLSQDYWKSIFLGDFNACRTSQALKDYGRNWARELRDKCPDHQAELRQAYQDRMQALEAALRVDC